MTCDVTDQVPLWRVNDVTYSVNQLDDGSLPGHTQTITANKSILIVSSPTNSTKYVCFVTEDDMDILSISVIVNIAGKLNNDLYCTVVNYATAAILKTNTINSHFFICCMSLYIHT